MAVGNSTTVTFEVAGATFKVPAEIAVRSGLVSERLEVNGADCVMPVPRKYIITSYFYIDIKIELDIDIKIELDIDIDIDIDIKIELELEITLL